MKSKLLFSNPIHVLFVMVAFGMFTISCSKEQVDVTKEDPVLNEKPATFEFFNIYAEGYEDLFTEDVWELMNSDPAEAMLELTGVNLQPPFGQSLVYVPYLSDNDVDYDLTYIMTGNGVEGINAKSAGAGFLFMEFFGGFDVTEDIDQNTYFSGQVDGDSNFKNQDVGLYYDLISSLPTPSGKPSVLNAVLINSDQTGDFSAAYGGFAVRATEDLVFPDNGPSATNNPQSGSTKTVTLGYLVFID